MQANHQEIPDSLISKTRLLINAMKGRQVAKIVGRYKFWEDVPERIRELLLFVRDFYKLCIALERYCQSRSPRRNHKESAQRIINILRNFEVDSLDEIIPMLPTNFKVDGEFDRSILRVFFEPLRDRIITERNLTAVAGTGAAVAAGASGAPAAAGAADDHASDEGEEDVGAAPAAADSSPAAGA